MTPWEQMEEWVARWVSSADCDARQLHEFLGLTWDEYAAWGAYRMTDAEAVGLILSRKTMAEPEGDGS